MKKWFPVLLLLLWCSASFAQQMPTTPVGQTAAEEGNFLQFMFEIGQWVIKLLLFGVIGYVVLAVASSLWDAAAPWVRGKITFAEVAGKVMGLAALMLLVLALGIWGIGFISNISLN